MRFIFAVLLSIALFSCMLPKAQAGNSLQQLYLKIKAANGFNADMIGTYVSAYLTQAFQNSNFTFKNEATFSLSSTELRVQALLPVWGTYVSATLVFTNVTALDLDLTFAANITQLGGLQTIVDKIAPSQWTNDLNQLVIADAIISIELTTKGKNTGLILSGSINLAANGIYGEVLVALIKKYANPLALTFYFPISATANAQSIKQLGFSKDVSQLTLGNVGTIHFSYCLPGTYVVSQNIWANNVCIEVIIGSNAGFDINCNLVFQAGNQNVTFASTGTFQVGQPISLQGNLESKWTNPFGLNWISFDSGSFTVVIDAQPQITLIGQGPLTFDPNSNCAIGLSIGLQGFVFSITGVPVNDLPGLYQTVSGKTPPHMLGSLHCQGTSGITVASFSTGNFQEGLTLQATSTITNSASELLKAQQQLQPSATPGSVVFDFKFFVPIFTPTEPVVISLTYTNTFPLHTGIQCTEYGIVATIGAQEVGINLNGNFAVQPANQPEPVTFSLMGNFQIGQSMMLSGQLTSPWPDAFGAKWLTITAASATLNLGKITSTDALNMDATGVFTFPNRSETVTMSLQSGNDFTQYCFTAILDSVWNVSVVADAVTGHHVNTVGDVLVQDNVQYTFEVCNYDGGVSPSGFTLKAQGTVVNNLAKRLAPISPNQIPMLNFDVSLYLPCFSTDPGNFHFYLNLQEPLPVTSTLTFDQLIFILQGGESGFGSLEIKYTANLNKNPAPISFDIKGVVTDTGTMTLTGFETGQWNDIFGIHGFDLDNVDGELAFGPTGLMDFGVGFTTVVGNKTITFAGNAAAPQFYNTFIEGSVTAAQNGKLILDFSDLALLWNKNVPSHPINMSLVPYDMGLQSAFISLAGQSGQFGSYTYEEGFHVKATMLMIDLTFAVDVGCSISGLSPKCDFNVQTTVDLPAMIAELKKFITMTSLEKYGDPNFVIWKLESCGLTGWATSLLSQGQNPMWNFDFIIFDSHKNINFESTLDDMEGSFENFYNKYIKHIF